MAAAASSLAAIRAAPRAAGAAPFATRQRPQRAPSLPGLALANKSPARATAAAAAGPASVDNSAARRHPAASHPERGMSRRHDDEIANLVVHPGSHQPTRHEVIRLLERGGCAGVEDLPGRHRADAG